MQQKKMPKKVSMAEIVPKRAGIAAPLQPIAVQSVSGRDFEAASLCG